MTDLFTPVRLGPYQLANRLVMAPMTRNRAGAGNVPGELAATYYAQRAGAGLIVTEATQVSPWGQGYPNTPGVHSPEQVEAWRRVTEAVHARGGRIFLQLWHVGRISHSSLQPGGVPPVAPSDVRPHGHAWTLAGMVPYETPRALETAEIAGVIDQFRAGAENALEAGFDGVEIHAANGYLIDQFLRDKTNRRSDRYGGAVANRARFLLEVAEAVADVWGRERVGVRLSPSNPYNDIADSDPAATFGHAIGELDRLRLAYLHLVEPTAEQAATIGARLDAGHFRKLWSGPLIACAGYDRARADAVLASGSADLIAFATLYLANPDLAERFRRGAPLNRPDRGTFYGGGAKGYTDYPIFDQVAV